VRRLRCGRLCFLEFLRDSQSPEVSQLPSHTTDRVGVQSRSHCRLVQRRGLILVRDDAGLRPLINVFEYIVIRRGSELKCISGIYLADVKHQ
jgi:hypothetical protein